METKVATGQSKRSPDRTTADVLWRLACNAFAVSLQRVPESVYLSTLMGEPIVLSRPIKDERFIIV
jgi:hypothetical protein